MQLVTADTNGLVQDLTIDAVSRKLYISDSPGTNDPEGRILRANLDGTDMETVRSGIRSGPVGIGVDPYGGKVYYARYNFNAPTSRIHRLNLDGTGIETVVYNVDADSLALDIQHQKVYWTEPSILQTAGVIGRASFDGSNIEYPDFGENAPGGIAIIPEPTSLAMIVVIAAFLVRSRRAAL